jgi:hypothetical protein
LSFVVIAAAAAAAAAAVIVILLKTRSFFCFLLKFRRARLAGYYHKYFCLLFFVSLFAANE